YMPPNAGTSIAIWANRSSNVPDERGTTCTPIEDAWTAGNMPITTRDTTATARTILATRRRDTMAIPRPQDRFGYMTATYRAAGSASRLASSAPAAEASNEAAFRIISFTSSPRITRPTRSTTATLGSGHSSRRQSGSSRTRRWSGSATPSLNAERETDEDGHSMIIPRPTLYRDAALADPSGPSLRKDEIGRASCRERVGMARSWACVYEV